MCLKQSCLLLTVLLSGVLGCDNPLSEKSEQLGLTNSEYITEAVSGGRGYPGASNIDTMYKNLGLTTGRSDRWTKVTISKADYEALWSNEAELAREKGYTLERAGDGRSLDRLLTEERLVPPDWPPSQFIRPSWWRLPSAGTPTEVTAWQKTIGKEDESDTTYADCGRYWVYDAGSGTLWVWRWRERY